MYSRNNRYLRFLSFVAILILLTATTYSFSLTGSTKKEPSRIIASPSRTVPPSGPPATTPEMDQALMERSMMWAEALRSSRNRKVVAVSEKDASVPVTTTMKAVASTSTVVTTTVLSPTATYDNCGPGKKKWQHARDCYFHLIQLYPWPQDQAFSVLYCESTGDPAAQNGSHWGLFQLDTGPFWEPEKNIEVAYNAYYKLKGNFSKWSQCL